MRSVPLIGALAVLRALGAAPGQTAAEPDLEVDASYPSDTGTLHYTTSLTLKIGTAKPLVLGGTELDILPIPGPHFRLSEGHFLLLGWSSGGGGRADIQALLIGVQEGRVVLKRKLSMTSDRGSTALLVRTAGPHTIRLGFPEPRFADYQQFDWLERPALSLGTKGTEFDLQRMKSLRFVPVVRQEGDLFYSGFTGQLPFPKRVAWIAVTSSGFSMVNDASDGRRR